MGAIKKPEEPRRLIRDFLHPDIRPPLDSAFGLADPAAALKALPEAAVECRTKYGALDVPWGQVFRYSCGKADLPGNGGPGTLGLFRTVSYGQAQEERLYASQGETFVCVIEFSQAQRAQCVLGYGNATQSGSPHMEDQLPPMAEKKLHPVWRERKDIPANLEKKEKF